MKIECTEKEKELIIKAFKYANLCPFEEETGVICNGNCSACMDKTIEWVIRRSY